MDSHELNNQLEKLHQEIKNTQAVDEKGSALLGDLEKEVRALIERSEDRPIEVHPTNIETLEGAIVHFELTHPSLTAQINKLLEILSSAGI
jgi:hypothetical protein